MLDHTLIVNHQLFSDYYLGQTLNRVTKKKNTQREKTWQSLISLYNRNSFDTEERLSARTGRFYDKVFNVLGFELQDSFELELEEETFNVSHALYADGKKVGLVQYLPYNLSYDKKRRTGRKSFPSYINTFQEVLEVLGLSWGLLINGETIRLVKAGGGKAYLEFKIAEMCRYSSQDVYESAFSVFFDIVQQEHFSDAYLDEVYEESKKHGAQVSETLKEAILESIELFARGVLSNPANINSIDDNVEELYQESIIFMYRMLFVLYAEAHNLLPLADNPVYKENYSIDSLVNLIRKPSFEPNHRKATLWKSLKALFKILESGINHKSCAIAALNGELNSSSKHSLLNNIELADDVMSEIIKRLTLTQVKGGGLDRISYRELDVAQLGSVYEGLLEYEPKIAEFNLTTKKIKNNEQLIRAEEDEHVIIKKGEFYLSLWGGSRKGSGSYYTPKELTTFLVEKTLEPLVKNKTSEQVLTLKVIDTAMGSGAFLVAAINYLARVYGQKLIDEGIDEDGIMDDDEFMHYKRVVAEHCIYGVDLKPTAVELAKLSIWLTTFAKDRPLTFLDHRLRAGNSLVGAWLEKDIKFTSPKAINGKKLNSLYFVPKEALSPSKKLHSKEHQESLQAIQKDNQDNQIAAIINLQTTNLLEQDIDFGFIESLVRHRINELNEEECNAEDVHIKAQLFEAEREVGSEFIRLKTYLDLTCSVWFWDSIDVLPPDSKELYDIRKSLFGEEVYFGTSNERIDELLHISNNIASKQLFFHWELEFPELYFDEDVKRLSNQGFDAVIGNPPWDMSIVNSDEFFSNFDPWFRGYIKSKAKTTIKQLTSNNLIAFQWNQYQLYFEKLTSYFKSQFIYQYKGQLNLYKLFMEHNFLLLKDHGHIGLVIPNGFYTDDGCQYLRRLYIDKTAIKFLFSFENKKKIFPIHSSTKFMIFSSEKGCQTSEFSAQFMMHYIDQIYSQNQHVNISKKFIENTSPIDYLITEIKNNSDVKLIEKIYQYSAISKSDEAFSNNFGRELNKTDDADYLIEDINLLNNPMYIPVFEGKNIHQFDDKFEQISLFIKKNDAESIFKSKYKKQYRIALRSIASSTNQRSLIGQVIYKNSISVHSMNTTVCDNNTGIFLLSIINSFVQDFSIRLKTNTNLNPFYLNQMPIPRLHVGDDYFDALVFRTIRLICTGNEYSNLWTEVTLDIDFNQVNTNAIPLNYSSKVNFSQCTDNWNDSYIISGKTDTTNRFDIGDRAQLRAEIDAIVAHLYGLNHDEMSYILDTFTALRNGEEREFGEFKSKRMVLEEMKRLEECQNA